MHSVGNLQLHFISYLHSYYQSSHAHPIYTCCVYLCFDKNDTVTYGTILELFVNALRRSKKLISIIVFCNKGIFSYK